MSERKQRQIPGSFIDPEVAHLSWRSAWRRTVTGGVIWHAYEAAVSDGVLRAIVAQEPHDPRQPQRLLWHLSVSHAVPQIGFRGDSYVRCPTYDELKSAKYILVPQDVEMHLVFPRAGAGDYVDDHPTTLHLWESSGCGGGGA